MAQGDIQAWRFVNHRRTSRPSQGVLDEQYSRMNEAEIIGKTGFANWFIATLEFAPSFGGEEGRDYVIFNPTNSNGAPVIVARDESKVVCAAPCPPFCDEEQQGLVEIRLDRIEDRLDSIEVLLRKILQIVTTT